MRTPSSGCRWRRSAPRLPEKVPLHLSPLAEDTHGSKGLFSQHGEKNTLEMYRSGQKTGGRGRDNGGDDGGTGEGQGTSEGQRGDNGGTGGQRRDDGGMREGRRGDDRGTREGRKREGGRGRDEGMRG